VRRHRAKAEAYSNRCRERRSKVAHGALLVWSQVTET
jgi:hypothetical protein